MARRKTGDKKPTRREVGVLKVQAGDHSIAFEELQIAGNVGGDIRIGHTIGYTAKEVSVLLKQITTTLQPKKFDGRCPYKGLEVFEEEDAELFFGRERLVNELVGRVKESRTVFITGPSGSGKSSLVRAGLIYALKQGGIKSSERWLYETMKPGREPIKDLALAFSRLKSPELEDYFLSHTREADILNKCAESVLSGRKDQRFVLFIDQFEEVFTQINSEEERVAFINMLAHAGTVENGRVIVLFAMRSDFVSNCATYPALNELLSQEFRQIGAMQPEELVNAIALPARHVGLPIEDELIARIINDMKGEPDALPLMQFALKDLFDAKQTDGGVIALTLADYLKHGGIHKSLERHADATFAKLSENEQELTRSIFSGLIEVGRGTQDTKRTALFDELIPANTKAEEVLAIVQKLADARLIITDEQAGKDTVTISHEKLIEAWPWLKKLVNENRDAIALQNEIISDAKEWDDHWRDPSYLYTGARLANTREQVKARKLLLSGLAEKFVQAGNARKQRGQMIVITGLSVVIFLLAIAVIVFSRQSSINASTASTAQAAASTAQAANTFAIAQQFTAQAANTLVIAPRNTAQAANTLAVSQANEAQRQATIARSRELASQSKALRSTNIMVSWLLGLEAFKSQDTAQTRNILIDNLQINPPLQKYLSGHVDSIFCVVFSSNGKVLASGGKDGTIILWNAETGEVVQTLLGFEPIVSLRFSSDGKTLAAGYQNPNSIVLWDVETGEGRGVTRPDNAFSVDLSSDGKILAFGGPENTIILWDVEKEKTIGQPLSGHDNVVYRVAFSPDGKILASGGWDGKIILWDVRTGETISQLQDSYDDYVLDVTFSPDGKILASASSDTRVTLWNVETGKRINDQLNEHNGAVNSVTFSPDGNILASGSDDGNIILWDVKTGESIGRPLNGDVAFVSDVAFSPDGKTLAAPGFNNTIIFWDVSSVTNTAGEVGQLIYQLQTRATKEVTSMAFSPNGSLLASTQGDEAIRLWDVKTGGRIGEPLTGHTGNVTSVAFSPDGKTLASGSWDETIILWDVGKHKAIVQLSGGHAGAISKVAFSPDGSLLASASYDDTIILWDVKTGKRIGEPLTGHTDNVTSVAFSPDGSLLASAGDDNTIILWDLKRRDIGGQPLDTNSNVIAFSPDGGTLAVGSEDSGIITLWDIERKESLGQLLDRTKEWIIGIAFSPDGKVLASNKGNAIFLWDVQTEELIGQLLDGHSEWIASMVFSPDGKVLALGSTGQGSIILWDMDPLSWVQKTCQRVGRNFTQAEWTQYFPNEKYRVTCPQWPSGIR